MTISEAIERIYALGGSAVGSAAAGENAEKWGSALGRVATGENAEKWGSALGRVFAGVERVGLVAAAGRVLAQEVCATSDAPRFSNSAMDGYAVAGLNHSSWQIAGAPVFAGDFTPRELASGSCCKIMTGALLPDGAEAVLMVENAELSADGSCVQNTGKALKPGENMRFKGEEYAANTPLLARGTLLNSAHIMLAAANGCSSLLVARRPRVGIFASGDELLEPYERGAGVYNSNAYGAAALCAGWADAAYLGILPDAAPAVARKIAGAAAEFELLITIGAASMGDADYVKSALQEAGFAAVFSRVELKPGGPVGLFAREGANDAKRTDGAEGAGRSLVLVLPGNPMSAYTCMQLFLPPLRALLQGLSVPPPQFAPLAKAVHIGNKKENVIYGRLNERGEFCAHNDGKFSSGQITPIAASTHFARLHASNCAGEMVAIYPVL